MILFYETGIHYCFVCYIFVINNQQLKGDRLNTNKLELVLKDMRTCFHENAVCFKHYVLYGCFYRKAGFRKELGDTGNSVLSLMDGYLN